MCQDGNYYEVVHNIWDAKKVYNVLVQPIIQKKGAQRRPILNVIEIVVFISLPCILNLLEISWV